jgi:peroxiredoxin
MTEFLRSHDVRVFIIGSGMRPVAGAVMRLLSSPHTFLYDSDRSAYRAWGLLKRLGLIQMSGTFVLDGDGVVRYAHKALNPFDSFRKSEITSFFA